MSIALAVCLVGGVSSAGQSGQPPSETIRIRVLARRPDGDAITYLKAGSFRLRLADGRLIRAFMSHATGKGTLANRIRVLLIVSPDFEGIVNSLPSSFGKVDIALSVPGAGTAKYCSKKDALLAEITNGLRVRQSYGDALKQLGDYDGPRAVIYVATSRGRTLEDIRIAAVRAGALIYQVGGDPADNYTFDGVETTGPSLPGYGQRLYGPAAPPANGATFVNSTRIWDSFAVKVVNELRVERSLEGALRDISKDAAGYYNLTTVVPNGSTKISLGLSIEENYQLNVEAYDVNGSPAPSLSFSSEW